MKSFKSVFVTKTPRIDVWRILRDELPLVATHLNDIERIRVETRASRPNGDVQIVNSWQARVAIPAALAGLISPEQLAWIDRATWHQDKYLCSWTIEPEFVPERITCSGTTRYEDAMAGRGTRVTFEGSLGFFARKMFGVPALLEGTVELAVEAFIGALVPGNFQKLGQALAAHVKASESAATAGSAGGSGLNRQL